MPPPVGPVSAGSVGPVGPVGPIAVGGGRATAERDASGRPTRVWTVANVVTVVRIGCIPVFVWLLVRDGRHGWFAAAVLLAVLGATDGVDGQLARRLGQVSELGKVLDPVADRLLVATAGLSVVAVGAVPAWVAVLALAREAVVAGGFVVLGMLGARRIAVSVWGKAATFGVMCTLPLFLAGHSTVSWHEGAEVAAWVVTGPALLLGWTAVGGYLPAARRALAEGRGADR